MTPTPLSACVVVALLAAPALADEKKSAYPFALPPDKVVVALSKLEKYSGHKRQLSEDEKSLLADIKAGRFEKLSMAEAALLADGVLDRKKRRDLLKTYQEIRAAAKKAIAGATSPAEKGKKLLEYLHDEPMKAGYKENQTLLASILENGTYNCVSSAVLYNVLASDLGLEVDAVEIPGSFLAGHVYSRLRVEKKWIVVETTNKEGFDKERKMDSSDRVLTPAGLVASILSNRVCFCATSKQYHEAAVLSVLMSGLDAEAKSNRAGDILGKWAMAVAEQKQFGDAQAIHATALEIEPGNSNVKNNRHVLYLRWADHLDQVGTIDDTLALLDRAGKDDPDSLNSYVEHQARLFTRRGERLIEKGEWEKAYQVVAAGHEKVKAKKALEELTNWQRGMYLRWGNSHLRLQKHDLAIAVYEKGLKLFPDASGLSNNVEYSVQEWLALTLKKQGRDDAHNLAVSLKKKYAGQRFISGAMDRHVRDVQATYLQAGKFEDARAALKRSGTLLSEEQVASHLAQTYVAHAQAEEKKNGWKAAVAVYAGGLKDHPKNTDLQKRAAGLWDAEAKKHMQKKEWAKAIALYEEGLKLLPGQWLLENNLKYCQQEMKRTP